jgi:hypothetical protein
VSWCSVELPNDALPTFTTGLVALVVAACMVAAPLIKPETAAATIRDFIECFIWSFLQLVRPGLDGIRRWGPVCAVFDSPAPIRLQHFLHSCVEDILITFHATNIEFTTLAAFLMQASPTGKSFFRNQQ